MIITRDIYMYGEDWVETIDKLLEFKIFTHQPHFQIYSLSAAIGIFYDMQIDINDKKMSKSVPRLVVSNNQEYLKEIISTAILSSKKIPADLSEDEVRIKLSFDDEYRQDFDRIDFLTKFANFGITKLKELLGSSDLETIVNFNNYFTRLYEDDGYAYIEKIKSDTLFK